MAQVIGTVISIELDTQVAKNGGGSYAGWELVYKTQDGKVQTIAKPVQGLKFNKPLENQLKELKSGDLFTLTQEKNAAGFNEVKSIIKGAEYTDNSAPSKPAQSSSNAPSARAPSTYETPEERKLRQRLIVRQSSLSNAVDILSVGSKSVNPEDVKALAQNLADWVYAEDFVRAEDMESDIPD